MDDVFFEELDQEDIERIEEDNDAPVGPDEAEEEKVTSTRDVKPKKIISKPRLKLDDKRLKGPRGLCVLEPVFKNIKFKGHGHERKDLDTVMSVLEHWAHRLFPKMTFDDCLEKIEDLGHKKSVSSYVTLLRNGCGEEETEVNNEVVDRRSPSPEQQPVDPFDSLLDQPVQSQLTQEQRERMERNQLIAIERRRAKLKAKYEKTNTTQSVGADNINTDITDSERTESDGTTGVNVDSLNIDKDSSTAINDVNMDIVHETADHGSTTIDKDVPDSISGEKVEREMPDINNLVFTDNIDCNERNDHENVVQRTVELSCNIANGGEIVEETSEFVDSSIVSNVPLDNENGGMDVDLINFDDSIVTNSVALLKSDNDVGSQANSPEIDSVTSEVLQHVFNN